MVKKIILDESVLKIEELIFKIKDKDHSVKFIEDKLLKSAAFRDQWPLKKKLITWYFRNLGYNEGTSYRDLSYENVDFS